MLSTVISLISGLVDLGISLYKGRADAHQDILDQWRALQSKSAELEAALNVKRADRDAATLAALESMKHG